ncbi:hypothetical protein EXU30_09145 [Shewanella maritima]|uniref:DUF2798 domain-containing protein n=1 Tax=Shewanella maritima TaxID=2520507 RepID=A0A411PGV1_9GAMM|nr:hypothetical protein [Shewanella maritima]QBF82839.1 hypothetical protein EXU30_09145 [Shewanella maritima]
MSENQNNSRRTFGLLVSITFSLAMNLIFLTAYKQPFDMFNWLMQLPLTIPAGALVGIGVSVFITTYAPELPHHFKGLLFSFLMSVVMSAIMVPFALIPRVGFDVLVLIKAVGIGVPVGMFVAYLVVPMCNWLVFRKYGMPKLG